MKQIIFPKANSFSVLCYTENETLHIQRLKECSEVEIAMDLASKFHFKKLKQETVNVTRLKGDLFVDHGKHQLLSENEQVNSKCRPLLHWGSFDLDNESSKFHWTCVICVVSFEHDSHCPRW